MSRYKEKAHELIEQYSPSSPRDLADKMGIEVIVRPMPESIRGFFITVFGQPYIAINSYLDDDLKNYTICHEIGHSVLHEGIGFYFLVNKTYFVLGKFERQAEEIGRILYLAVCCGEEANII